jgi:hypothetical protein
MGWFNDFFRPGSLSVVTHAEILAIFSWQTLVFFFIINMNIQVNIRVF